MVLDGTAAHLSSCPMALDIMPPRVPEESFPSVYPHRASTVGSSSESCLGSFNSLYSTPTFPLYSHSHCPLTT